MGKRVSTIIIEPRLVLREALELLMGNHSYRVVCGVGSIAEIEESSVVTDGPELVILGAQSADDAADVAGSIRVLWPESKVIFLFDYASSQDFQNLLQSQIDGCIPLFVSPETLIHTLDLIVSKNVRVMVMRDTKAPVQENRQEPQQGNKAIKPHSNGGNHNGMSASGLSIPPVADPAAVGVADAPDLNDVEGPAALSEIPKLSEREAQILDGLVKGYANKVIARRCDITEATVKVHMKSILRKIRVGNRTQAAIWALEHGYCSDEFKAALPRPLDVPQHHSIHGFATRPVGKPDA